VFAALTLQESLVGALTRAVWLWFCGRNGIRQSATMRCWL